MWRLTIGSVRKKKLSEEADMDYVPHSKKDIEEMLKVIGVGSIDELFESIPESARFKGRLNLPEPLSEMELRHYIGELSAKNLTAGSDYSCFLGGGAYFHFIPALVDELSTRGEFYTAYTPYQAEASQGTLQTIFEYQSCICALCKMDVSNASHYDGATAFAEAAIMGYQIHNRKRERLIVAKSVHPEYRRVLRTYLRPLGIEVLEVEYDSESGTVDLNSLKDALDERVAAVAFQTPNFFGAIEDGLEISELAHSVGAKLIASVDPLSLAILRPPGDYHADIAVGDGQPLGNYTYFGGPAFGFFATRKEYVRRMPGRIAGQTLDRDGRVGYVLTFQTREQHIRREKATSNICTNQALCAMRALIHLVAMGKRGVVKLALLCLQKAHYAADKMREKGCRLRFNSAFFREFIIDVEKPEMTQKRLLREEKILIGPLLMRWYPELSNSILVAFTEMNRREEIDRLIEAVSV